MRLDLRDVIHRPDAEKSFQYQLDLSQLDFYGRKPITRPVVAEGSVINHAGALVLNGTARSELDLVCDRCGKEFSREKVVPLDSLLAEELENEDSEDEIFLLDGNELDLDEGGHHGLRPRDGYNKPLLRRLQRAVYQVRCRSEPRPLRVQT